MVKCKNVILILLLVFNSCQQRYKKQAENFIQQNIGRKMAVEKKIIDKNGNAILFSPYSFETLYQAKDSLELLLKRNSVFTSVYKDADYIPDSFIEKHVDLMLKIRNGSPVLKAMDFNKFCEFVLPYRGGSEIFVDYHSTLKHAFKKVADNLPENAETEEIVTAINSELKKRLEFDLRSHAQLKEPDILEVLKQGKGSCNSLTALAAQTMRFWGIPAAIDECPVWGHRNAGHRWNAFLREDGKWIPFGGAETNPNEFNTINDSVKAPKIYRHTYSQQKGYQPILENKDDIPDIFLHTNRIDVTNQYVNTSDITIELKNKDTDENGILYLGVFNAKQWRIVAWANLKNGKANFKNMGNNNIVFLPMFYKDGMATPASSPFILSQTGERYIAPDTIHKISVELKYHNLFFDYKWNLGVTNTGRNTELYYWDNEWVLCGKYQAGEDHLLRFSNVPQNALYWIKSDEWDNTWQRIFTIKNGEQFWF